MASTVFETSAPIFPLNQQADLVGFFFDILPDAVDAGDSLTIDFTIQNSGDIPSGLFDIDFYLSTDTTINPFSDAFIGTTTSNVPAVSLLNDTITLSLPGVNSSFWSGSDTYYIGMILDSTNLVDESNENNNSSVGLFFDYDEIFVTVDDAYEENDSLATAFDLSADEQTFLSSIAGEGIQADDDWYEIEVNPGFENLVVDLLFNHANGDLDLALYDAAGTLLTTAESVTDNESIDVLLSNAGTYYLQVYGFPGDTFNTYDLVWDDQLYLLGTAERDVLDGTAASDTLIGLRGDDDLFGLGGDDDLQGDRGDDDILGGSGDDIVEGGRGDDVLNGVNPAANSAGLGEIDILIGGFGADVFELGDFVQPYYDDGSSTAGTGDYALITDFAVGEDVIQLHGSASSYQLNSTAANLPAGVGIFLQATGQAELIAIVQGSGNLDLNSASFSFV